MMWDIDQMQPLSATVVLSLFTPSFRRSTASSGRTIKYYYYHLINFLTDHFLCKRLNVSFSSMS